MGKPKNAGRVIFTLLTLSTGLVLATEPAFDVEKLKGSWVSGNGPDNSFLEIKKPTKTDFEFAISATSGANIGEMEGKAKWTQDLSEAKATVDKCKIQFKLSKNAMEVETEGDCGTPNGVMFDGSYLAPNVRPVFETSFACRADNNDVEKEICLVEWLANADRELAKDFTALLKSDPLSEKNLKKEQQKWVRNRDKECLKKTDKAACIAKHYAKRLVELRHKKTPSKKTLDFQWYVKSDLDASRDALRKDPLIELLIRIHLPEELADLFLAHNIYFSEPSTKPSAQWTEISICPQIRGISQPAGLVLTRDGGLWVMLVTHEEKKQRTWVFGPKSAPKKKPEAVVEWLSENNPKSGLSVNYRNVF